jgi:hypothetical protein
LNEIYASSFILKKRNTKGLSQNLNVWLCWTNLSFNLALRYCTIPYTCTLFLPEWFLWFPGLHLHAILTVLSHKIFLCYGDCLFNIDILKMRKLKHSAALFIQWAPNQAVIQILFFNDTIALHLKETNSLIFKALSWIAKLQQQRIFG